VSIQGKCPGQDKRFWTQDDIFEIPCGQCGESIEFFKTDGYLRCPKCHAQVSNPKVTLGCAQWCAYAKECLGFVPEKRPDSEVPGESSVRDRIIHAMRTEFGDDERRINHALLVLQFSEALLRDESASPRIVVAAALLHDIGIQEAERKHGACTPQYQELEGPPIARRILETEGLDLSIVDHVCRIVGSHHSGGDIDTPEFRIVWDADWLVNIPEQFPDADRGSLERIIDKTFRTKSGKAMATRRFLAA